MMTQKIMAIVGAALAMGTGALGAPTPAKASPATEYAVEQCGNGGWEELEYPTYEACYTTAVEFYFQQTGGGGAGGGGGTWIPNLPGWTPGSGWGCGATHLPCNPNG